MQHETPEERNAMQMMALVERITTLENENGELKRVIREMEAKTALQENAIKEVTGRCSVIEAATMEICSMPGNWMSSTGVSGPRSMAWRAKSRFTRKLRGSCSCSPSPRDPHRQERVSGK